MNFTPSSGRELQTEYFVPRVHGHEAILAVEELRDRITPHLLITELRAIAADDSSAPLLQVAPGSPLLLVERVSFTYGERPVEVRIGLCVTREHYYHNMLA